MNKMEMAKSLIREAVLKEMSKSSASVYKEGVSSFKKTDPELQTRKEQTEKLYKYATTKLKKETEKLNKRENRKETVGKLLQRGKQAVAKISPAVKAGVGKVKEHFKDPEETSKLIPKFNMPGASPLKRLNLIQPQKNQEPVAKSIPTSKSGPIVHNVTILGNGPYLK